MNGQLPGEPMLDRYQGCLVGLAIGDALGAPYEFSKAPVNAKPTFQEGYFGTRPGAPTDDSMIAGILCDSLIEWEDLDEDDYMGRLADWLDTNPPDVGAQTARAIRYYDATGKTPAESPSAGGNGALMAVAPLALRYATQQDVGDIGAYFSTLTHPQDDSRKACRLMCEAVAEFVTFGEHTPPAVHFAAYPKGTEFDGPLMGWSRLTIAIATNAVARIRYVETMEAVDTLLGVIRLGGDTDTNAAVTGALLGARFGMAAWPKYLLDTLEGLDEWLARAQGLYDLALA